MAEWVGAQRVRHDLIGPMKKIVLCGVQIPTRTNKYLAANG
nr:MAG TPA: hypothetical protein [Caudoviricetes sp.]